MSRERLSRPPHGVVAFSAKFVKSGVPLPIHPFLHKALAYIGLAPHQLNPNFIKFLFCMYVLWMEHHRIEFNLDIIKHCTGCATARTKLGFSTCSKYLLFFQKPVQPMALERNLVPSWWQLECVAKVKATDTWVAQRFR